ncbi:protein of unknown function DUF81 [Thermodesulfatator indicus DSM 15286]|uniref:Probable membrane transporter protein n=1 Tax=Thermodesulfatator indicus (strain DSM 15286 / JCM 11887 / CIR29812) TaxID=667014 RepID=F8A8E4_THEID|nr:sulfite exporter TauE/SafE family protein [Thermodesulfatator indicus]AEH43948.1 protein of unknown function DUF81 [Thermodesulfatator indicus DSM 15286]
MKKAPLNFLFKKVTFPISGVKTWIFLPPLVAFFLAYFGSMAGVTGAFLLLPFQMSVLGYTTPGVSATNFFYNLFAIPGSLWRYTKQGRLNWPLSLCISLGSASGIVLGYFLRIKFLTDPSKFKPFAGFVLLYLAFRLGKDLVYGKNKPTPSKKEVIVYLKLSLKEISFSFDQQVYSFSPSKVFGVSFLVGIAGGAYGIGGGAIMSPYCVSMLGLPVHTVAGASLLGTFISSVIGVTIYTLGLGAKGISTKPDYLLGVLFGLGGLAGGILGARTQKFIPERPIKLGLFLVVLLVSLRYLLSWF